MKKTLFIVVLTSALILSACSTSTSPTTSETALTTEATTTTEVTTTTTEVTTTTSAAPVLEDKPETYADVNCYNEDETDADFASDFEFVNASLFKDENNVFAYPNYQAGENIVVKFKSEKIFKFGSIHRYDSSKQYDDNYMANIVWKDGNIAGISERKIGNYTSNISKFLSYKDGIYTLTIPSKYAKVNNRFLIKLYTKYTRDEDMCLDWGDRMTFFIRCEKESIPAKPTFTPEQHANVTNMVKATDFNFANAELPVRNDGHLYYSSLPLYPVGKDIVISFKSKTEVTLNCIDMWSKDSDDETEITDSNYVNCVDGTYTVTIPSKFAQSGTSFVVFFSSKSGDELRFTVAC